MGPVGRQTELEESAEPVKGKRGLIRRVSEDRGMAGGRSAVRGSIYKGQR